ncbi:hypothetical protein SVIO_069040 [Streptomyces violaceusniger]|uniref:Uncharacterized protein n=1 Tax=Streptomyces violaceusniger TaxID=68280 RepID=A0A4D4L3S8_STRVO|nr:hypothetical protein SVIO_069040 [Streptomyces violaceusniger]
MVQGEVADDGVVETLVTVGALLDAVAVPPGAELRHLDAELADQLVQPPVLGVASGGQAQIGDEDLRDLLPIAVQLAGGRIEQNETGQVALAVRQRVEVGEQGAGQMVRGQDIAAVIDGDGRTWLGGPGWSGPG